MALNSKKPPFGMDLEERVKGAVREHTHTHTDPYEHTDTDTDIIKQETKSKRLYLLAKPSVHQKLNEYAKSKGDTFNNLVHTLMEQFIEDNNL